MTSECICADPAIFSGGGGGGGPDPTARKRSGKRFFCCCCFFSPQTYFTVYRGGPMV